MKNGEKVERERGGSRKGESHGILSSPRLLKMYTEMITSATTIAGGCVIYLRIPISTLALMFFTSERNCTWISLRCNIEETNRALSEILIF